MPLLFYGDARSVCLPPGRQLYNEHYDEVLTSVFDYLRIDGLAPKNPTLGLCHLWHLRNKRHSALSWNDPKVGHEQTVFIPTFVHHMAALQIARMSFHRVMPSPTILRFVLEHEVLLYD